jgi:hypothetical protein
MTDALPGSQQNTRAHSPASLTQAEDYDPDTAPFLQKRS